MAEPANVVQQAADFPLRGAVLGGLGDGSDVQVIAQGLDLEFATG